jgi:hypothetical protein
VPRGSKGNLLPTPGRTCEPSVLAAGKRFHREVQAAYVAGLLGVKLSEVAERTIVPPGGGRRRADILLLVASEPERMQFVVEIKSTLWQGRTVAKQRALLLAHMRQMHSYLDVLLEDVGRTVDSVVPALLYPQRPSEETVEQLEAITLSKGIMLVFYDDMDWHHPGQGSRATA